jgi:hypothetical protein
MLDNMRRLHPRGAASRGICVDADGAMLGPDCVLVQRTSHGYRRTERSAAAVLQKVVLRVDQEGDWLFRQAGRIADALDKGEVALAQIYGLRISINELDPQQLAKLSATARLTKTGYNPDEPRLPKGDRHGGEWTTGGGGSEASTITGHPTGPFAIDAMTVDSSTGGGDSGDGDASAGTPASGDNANGGGRRNQRRRSPPSSGR